MNDLDNMLYNGRILAALIIVAVAICCLVNIALGLGFFAACMFLWVAFEIELTEMNERKRKQEEGRQ